MRAIIAIGLLLLTASPVSAVTRDQVMATAKAYVFHPWRCASQNQTATCEPSYKSVFPVGDYLGVAYDWGGFDSLFTFDQMLSLGHGAGTQPSDGVLACTTGVDCSGYVSRCWDHSPKLGTYTIEDNSTTVSQSQLLAGDVMNKAGTHVVLFSHTLASGTPVWYEAGTFVTEIDYTGSWSKVSGYTPRRYDKITGTTAGNPQGTVTNPIVIGSLPYSDSRDTSKSMSDVLDGCAAAATTDESGPEVVYEVSFTQPGSLTVGVSDGPGVDIDVHLYESTSTNDCVARHDTSFTQPVDCGTYYIVADTFKQAAGPYTLTVSFTPAGGSCGSGPPSYDPPGELGDPCKNVDPVAYCNQTLGAEMCVYTSSTSWCTTACTVDSDCTAAFPGGCCKDISGKGEYYCEPSSYCGGTVTPDSGPVVTPEGGVTPPGDGGAVALDTRPPPGVEAGLPSGDAVGIPADSASGHDGDKGGGGCTLRPGPARTCAPGLVLLLLLLALRRRSR